MACLKGQYHLFDIQGRRTALAAPRGLTHWQRHPASPVLETDPRYHETHWRLFPSYVNIK